MARIGYARVSTTDEDLEAHLTRLAAEGCTIGRSEKASAASRKGRTELAPALAFLRASDELVVPASTGSAATPGTCSTSCTGPNSEAHVTVLDPHVSTRGEMS